MSNADIQVGSESQELLDRYGDALRAGQCRIEFGLAFPLNGSSTLPTATLWVKQGNRWERVSPYLAANEGEDRADLLQTLVNVYRQTEKKGTP